MTSSDQTILIKFYTATENINFVEKARVVPSMTHVSRLKLQITPVGETSNEFKLKVSNL